MKRSVILTDRLEIERMEWYFLRVVDERTNVINTYESPLVCSARW